MKVEEEHYHGTTKKNGEAIVDEEDTGVAEIASSIRNKHDTQVDLSEEGAFEESGNEEIEQANNSATKKQVETMQELSQPTARINGNFTIFQPPLQ